jgi:hypothetical protein
MKEIFKFILDRVSEKMWFKTVEIFVERVKYLQDKY